MQEGVYTFETVNDAVAEPVVYMIDHFVVGGFYRVHTERGTDENLNAPGMHFVPLAFETPASCPTATGSPDAPPNRFYAYGVVARLAMLAAAVELEELVSRRIRAGGRGRRTHEARFRGRSARPASRPTRTPPIAMMREAARRGHEVHALDARALFLRDGSVRCTARRLSMADDDHAWYRALDEHDARLSGFDAGPDAQGPALRPGVLLRHAAARDGARRRARAW